MIEPWLLWRLAKFAGLVLFAGGVLAVAHSPSRATRLRLTYGYTVAGFVGTWVAGWMLMKLTDREPSEPWILVGMAMSGVALHATFLASHKDRERAFVPALAAGGLLASAGAMVLRMDSPVVLAATILAGLLLGALVCPPWRSVGLQVEPEVDRGIVRQGFRGVAWAEGASLLALMGVAMPLRAATGIDLDGESGLLGWIHGVLVLVYIQTLASTAQVLGWSWSRTSLAFAAAMVPGGTFAFDAWLSRQEAPPSSSSALPSPTPEDLPMYRLCLALLLSSCTPMAAAIPEVRASGVVDSACTLKGHRLAGKVQIVDSFPDLKVQVVTSFPDLKVRKVDSFPDDCGEWQVVESFPDFKIQIVDSFPDLKVQYVDAFPGVP